MESIELLPRAYPLVHGQTRKALVARFPYALFFSVDGDVVVVEAVFHTARDPRWLHERWN